MRHQAALLAAAVVLLHVVGFSLLFAGGAIGAGVGLTAYTLGLRHAFDADHVAAIDNATRKLLGEGRRSLGVGFFFSLGHSTVVFVLGVVVGLGARGAVQDDHSLLHQAGGVIGPVVSGSFLCLIGCVNLVGLVRGGGSARGPMTKLFGRATRAVRKPWQMYPLGCLFGLGFDTATEIGLLALAGGAAAGGLPAYEVLCLPVLFAAGMSLLDTLDGAFMSFAYRWAIRDSACNAIITGLSAAVALGVGAAEVVPGIDLGLAGVGIVALFAATWAGAGVAVSRK
jgi:high-affinity nickel-transport protein